MNLLATIIGFSLGILALLLFMGWGSMATKTTIFVLKHKVKNFISGRS